MAAEKQLISLFLDAFPVPGVRVGPGDDAGVVSGTPADLCVTTDALVEDVHFTRRHFSPEDIGHKALAVNLSDLAAMGATPRWFVCALTLPLQTPAADVRRMAQGMAALARAQDIALIGGNFSRGRDLTLTLTCAGDVPARSALRRDGARAGDWLYVSGTLGDARLGFEQLGRRSRFSAGGRERQRRPTPRVALGQLARRYARAAMDISDGLARDLTELCHRSGVGLTVDLECLPVSAALRKHLPAARARALFALRGGEDYELILAVPPRHAKRFEQQCAGRQMNVTCIGKLTADRAVNWQWEGKAVAAPGGFDHFA